MKKVLNVVAVCAVVLLALTGCTGQADTAGSSTSESQGIVVSDTDQKETSSLSESTGDVSSDEKETVSDADHEDSALAENPASPDEDRASGSESQSSQDSQAEEDVVSSEDPEQSEEAQVTDEDILEDVAPYLENAVFQDPSNYPTMNDFLLANLGLDQTNVANAVLYMGAPNGNTTFFLMLTKAQDGDTDQILEKLESKMQSLVETSKQGYTQGYQEYAIIEKEDRIFAVMHEDAGQYEELVAYLNLL